MLVDCVPDTDLSHSWAATTGRPSTLPGPYFRQCRALLDFELATLRDTMLYAEITLYSIIEEKLSRESFLESDGACEELTGWKQKWSHLLGWSMRSLYKFGESRLT